MKLSPSRAITWTAINTKIEIADTAPSAWFVVRKVSPQIAAVDREAGTKVVERPRHSGHPHRSFNRVLGASEGLQQPDQDTRPNA